MDNFYSLTGNLALVIGGSGGIGRFLAKGLAEAGADVAVVSRSLDHLEPVAKEISALGRKSLAVAADITDESSVQNMVDSVLKIFPRIDILVNTAGMNVRESPESIKVNDWQKVMDLNVRGVFLCCQAVGRTMIKNGGGKIINMSSVRGRYAFENAIVYSTSKAAVDAMTRVLAFEWAKYNILVNAVAPTLIKTELTLGLLSNPEIVKKITADIPLGRLGVPQDLIGITVFLASKASNFMTGQILYVDGGSTCYSK